MNTAAHGNIIADNFITTGSISFLKPKCCTNIPLGSHYFHIPSKGQGLSMKWALVAHTCNPSYSGGRDQEDLGQTEPTRANSSQDPSSKTPNTEKVWRSGSWCRPEFKPQYHKKKKVKHEPGAGASCL
jgi:hypothetical protein